jgi:NAD(P)-dependent dehydrogenase (short-subunit alcohol dehydrogenase family)
MKRFSDKTAVVSGAAAGVGAAVAAALARDGARVVAFDRQAADDTVAAIAAAGGTAVAVTGDVRDGEDCAAAVASAAERFGGVDLLVCNAGVARYGTTDAFSDEDWDLVIDTNVKGAFNLARAAIPRMRLRGGGAIVNTASVQAFASQRLVTAYSASKGAVVAMTRTMALDHADDGIRVNAVAPGSVSTPMLRQSADIFAPDAPEAAMEEWGRTHPIGRLIRPEEVANVILFLLSDDASAVTGATYLVDGGLLSKLAV